MFKRKYYKIKIINLYWFKLIIIFKEIKLINKYIIKYIKILINILNMDNIIILNDYIILFKTNSLITKSH